MCEFKKMRISRYLSSCGLSSRRKCEEYVRAGKVKVNGEIIKDLSFIVTAGDRVEFDERQVKYSEKMTMVLNKPAGYLSTVRDDFKRKTVIDLINNKDMRLFPVGRLDYNSRGLIILTNDGDLAYRIMHPRYEVPKTYEVTIKGALEDKYIEKIKEGIEIEGRKLIPLNIKILDSKKNRTIIEIKIIEGRKRIIRKIFKKIGYNVIDLKRTMIGKLGLNGLKEGQARELKKEDLEILLSIR